MAEYEFSGKYGSWKENIEKDADAKMRAQALNVGVKKISQGYHHHIARGYKRKTFSIWKEGKEKRYPWSSSKEEQHAKDILHKAFPEGKKQGYHQTFKILKGKGWRRDSIRHSRARKYGRA